MLNKITVITLTLGRDTLAEVAADLAVQTILPAKWLLMADGPEAVDKCITFVKSVSVPFPIQVFETNRNNPLDFPRWFDTLDQVGTAYVALLDDDNRIEPKHIELLQTALDEGRHAVAVSRIYCKTDMSFGSKEHPMSELVDTNCMGVTTKILYEARKYWYFEHGDRFADLEFQSWLRARRLWFYRIPDAYTIRYRLRPMHHDPELLRDDEYIYETLMGHLFRFKISEEA